MSCSSREVSYLLAIKSHGGPETKGWLSRVREERGESCQEGEKQRSEGFGFIFSNEGSVPRLKREQRKKNRKNEGGLFGVTVNLQWFSLFVPCVFYLFSYLRSCFRCN